MSSPVTAIRLLYLENALRHDMPQVLAADGERLQVEPSWHEFDSGGVSVAGDMKVSSSRITLRSDRRIMDIFIASDSMVITNVTLDDQLVRRMSSGTVRRFHAFGQSGRHLKVFGAAIGRGQWPYFRYLITYEK